MKYQWFCAEIVNVVAVEAWWDNTLIDKFYWSKMTWASGKVSCTVYRKLWQEFTENKLNMSNTRPNFSTLLSLIYITGTLDNKSLQMHGSRKNNAGPTIFMYGDRMFSKECIVADCTRYKTESDYSSKFSDTRRRCRTKWRKRSSLMKGYLLFIMKCTAKTDWRLVFWHGVGID